MSIKTEFLNSFRDTRNGLSARKLTAFMLSFCFFVCSCIFANALYLEHQWATDLYTEYNVTILCGIAFFLGLVTVSQLIQLKNGSAQETPHLPADTPTTDSSELQTK